MSTVVRPSGPLPSRVYWVRRMLVLVVVLGMLWALWAVIGIGGDPASGEPKVAAQGDEVTDAPADPAPQTARETRRAKQQARQEKQRERRRLRQVQDAPQTFESPRGPCDLTLVAVAPEVAEPAYAGGAVPVRIGLRTAEPTACTLGLNPDRLLVAVSSGEATVWSSTDCPEAVPQRDVVLRPYWTSTVDLLWSGQRSGRRCLADMEYAAPGEYELQVAALTGEPASFAFTLTEPEAEAEPEKPPADDEADGRDEQGADGPADDEPAEDEQGGEPRDRDTEDQPAPGG